MHRFLCWPAAVALAMSAAPCLAEPAGPAETSGKDVEERPAACALDPEVSRAVAEVATAYLQALGAGGLGAASRYLHPLALTQFKTMAMPAFDAEQGRGTRSLLNATFGRDAVLMDARLASPEDFLTRFARVVSVRRPELTPGFDSVQTIGVLPEGERMHCLVRLNSGAGAESEARLEVVSLARDGDTWKVLLDGRLAAMAHSLAGRGERRVERPLMEPLPEGAPLRPAGPPAPGGLPGPQGLPPAPGQVTPPGR